MGSEEAVQKATNPTHVSTFCICTACVACIVNRLIKCRKHKYLFENLFFLSIDVGVEFIRN